MSTTDQNAGAIAGDKTGDLESSAQTVSKEDHEKVLKSLSDAQTALEEASKGQDQLQQTVQRLEGRLVQLQDDFVKGIESRPAASVSPVGPTAPQLDWGEMSETERGLFEHMGKIESGLKNLINQEKGSVGRALDSSMSERLKVEGFKRENPKIWAIVNPIAQTLHANDPNLGLDEGWAKAVELAKPFTDAKTEVDERLEKERKRAESEKPGGLGGGEKLTPDESASEEYDKIFSGDEG